MAATQLHAGRGGFSRARGSPNLRPMHTPAPGAVLGDPTSVEEQPIGYGQPTEPEPLRITGMEICPVISMRAVTEDGTVIDLAGSLDDLLPFARQVLAIHAAMPQAPQPAPVYEEPQYEEPHSQTG